MEDAAVAVVLRLVGGVDAAEQRHGLGGAVGAVDGELDVHARGDAAGDAGDVEGLLAGEVSA